MLNKNVAGLQIPVNDQALVRELRCPVQPP
jgi:hypothetical protein